MPEILDRRIAAPPRLVSAAGAGTSETDAPEAPALLAPETLRRTLDETVEYVLATCDYERTDRLCPAHFELFMTNPMSVAFGASGVALFLSRVAGEVPERMRRWMLDQPVTSELYAPGLFVGTSGIALALAEVGMVERGEELMAEAYRSPLLFDEASLFHGAAGWGFASLWFWDRTGRQVYLDQAVRAAEHLVRSAEAEGETRFWRVRSESRIHYGYGFGASGVGLFLLHAHLRTGRDDLLSAAVQALEYDLANKLETTNGTTWLRYENDPLNYPYFVHGGAGVGAVVVRFARELGGERYRAWADEIAGALDMKWAVLPGLFDGLSGIAELSLDMHELTGEPAYLARAHDQAETVLWFRVAMPEGKAFPGRLLFKVSNDLGTGAAGIGLHLHRLLHPGPRLFVDLPLPRGDA